MFMPDPLSSKTISLIKSTVPALEAHGLAITERMYERLFQNAAIRHHFNQSHHGHAGSQSQALANAVLAYARNIDNPGVLGETIERITQKHVALNILPEHYPFVAHELLGAIQDVLGNAATPEICAAWSEAYWFLANILIGREAKIYRDLASQPGGWNGWRDFVVESVVKESAIIQSFVLVPADGKPVLRHLPGQYLGLMANVPDHDSQMRNYSISCGPNDRAYRITVKRESMPGVPQGIVSNWLHDQVSPGASLNIAPPAGDFFLNSSQNTPVVLASGGVGLTPMMSMLESIAALTPHRPTWYVHGALHGGVHAMGDQVHALAQAAPGIRVQTFYERPQPGDQLGVTHHEVGLISAEWLAHNTPLREATFFICGPKLFMQTIVRGLLARGVPAKRIRYEFFGPALDILEATSLAA
jgi:nitric oxide dioxygenase